MAVAEKIIAIIEVAVYVPLLLIAIALVFCHRLVRAMEWISLPLICGARIASAAVELGSGQFPHKARRWRSIRQFSTPWFCVFYCLRLCVWWGECTCFSPLKPTSIRYFSIAGKSAFLGGETNEPLTENWEQK